MKKLVLGIAILAAASTAGAFGPAERRAKELAAYQPAGEPVKCINTRQIKSTNILSNDVIDFKMTGGKHYRNSLPHSCPSLKFEDRFGFTTTGGQLCSIDTIRVLHNYGGRLEQGVGCSLGKFQPMEKSEKVEEIGYTDGEWTPFEIVETGPVTQ